MGLPGDSAASSQIKSWLPVTIACAAKVIEGKNNMAGGIDAVKQKLAPTFGSVKITEQAGLGTEPTKLYFSADGRHFTVSVCWQFDQDYASGQLKVDLDQLGDFLRTSKNGNVIVTSKGILVPWET